MYALHKTGSLSRHLLLNVTLNIVGHMSLIYTARSTLLADGCSIRTTFSNRTGSYFASFYTKKYLTLFLGQT